MKKLSLLLILDVVFCAVPVVQASETTIGDPKWYEFHWEGSAPTFALAGKGATY